VSTVEQRIHRGDSLYSLLTRLPGAEFGAAPLCAETDPEVFMPDQAADSVHTQQAKAICRQCPIQQECLAFALRNGESGVWGGTSELERDRMRRGYLEAA